MNKKNKSIFLRLARTLLIFFVVGNSVAFFLGAYPISFERYEVTGSELIGLKKLESLHLADPENVDYAVGVSMVYFLNNHLDDAETTISEIAKSYPEDPAVKSLVSAINIKKAGEKLDFLFGQVKLSRIKEAINNLYSAAQQQPDDMAIQVLALATLVSVIEIGGSVDKAIVIGERLEKQLKKYESKSIPIPDDLAASSWLSVADFHLSLIRKNGESGSRKNNVDVALANYEKYFQRLPYVPRWLLYSQEQVQFKFGTVN